MESNVSFEEFKSRKYIGMKQEINGVLWECVEVIEFERGINEHKVRLLCENLEDVQTTKT